MGNIFYNKSIAEGNKLNINILTERRTANSKAFNYPISKNKRLLLDTPYHKRIYDCDLLWINSKVFGEWWGERQNEQFDLLQSYRKEIGQVIYFDTTDSSGTVQHEILPFVNKYCKFYLLKG